jgi:hypothetical protein
MKEYRSLAIFSLVAILFVSYNFMSAQWSAAPSNPPNNNPLPPINVSSSTQQKQGNFMANIVAAATSTWSPRYCDELGANCWDPASGAPGGTNSSTTIMVGGRCFEPTLSVGCMWNWSGDGNDTSIYLGPISMSPSQICADVGRAYQYHSIVLAECGIGKYNWSVTGWTACNAPPLPNCGFVNGTQTRTVQCVDRTNGNAVVADSFCSGGKPATSQACQVYRYSCN